MLADRRVIAFVATRQADRAREFYGRTLGLPLGARAVHRLL
jgi:catechol 2,3-dioxygenase-like lactoylglutathione lyase family enzyme